MQDLQEKFERTHETFRIRMNEIAKDFNKPVLVVYQLWRQYTNECQLMEQSPVLSEFVDWYTVDLSS